MLHLTPHSPHSVDDAYHLFLTSPTIYLASNSFVQLRFDFKYYHSLPTHFLWWNIFIFHLKGSFTNVSLQERKHKQNEDQTKLETSQGHPRHCLMSEIFYNLSLRAVWTLLLLAEEVRGPNVVNLQHLAQITAIREKMKNRSVVVKTMTGVKTVIYNFSIISMRQVSGWVSQPRPSDSPEAGPVL